MRLFLTQRKLFLLLLLLLILATPALVGGWQVFSPLLRIPTHLLFAFGLLVCSRWYLLGLRCYWIFRAHHLQLSLHKFIAINLACDFLAEWTPAGSGKSLSWFALLKQENVAYSTAAAAGLVNSLLDWSSLLLVLVSISSYLLIEHTPLTGSFYLLAALAFIALPTLTLAYLLTNARLLEYLCKLRWERHLPGRIAIPLQKLRHQLPNRLQQGLTLAPSTQFILLLVSSGYWLARLSLLFLALHMAGTPLTWPNAALTQFLAAMAGWFTFLPTGYPAADLTLGALLGQHMTLTSLLSVIILWRLMTLYTNLIAGGLAFLWLTSRNQPIIHTQDKDP